MVVRDWLMTLLGQGWPMMLLGVVPLGIGLALLARGLHLRCLGARTTGRLTGYQRTVMRTTRGRAVYQLPIVVFTAADGVEHTFTSAVGEPGKHWPVGTAVVLYYLPHRPQRAEIAGLGAYWLVPLGLSVLGAIPMAIGVLMSMSN